MAVQIHELDANLIITECEMGQSAKGQTKKQPCCKQQNKKKLKDTHNCAASTNVNTNTNVVSKKKYLYLLERTLSQQVTLDTRQSFVRIVICLLNECQLLALGLVESAFHTAQKKNKQQSEGKTNTLKCTKNNILHEY